MSATAPETATAADIAKAAAMAGRSYADAISAAAGGEAKVAGEPLEGRPKQHHEHADAANNAEATKKQKAGAAVAFLLDFVYRNVCV